MEEDLFQFLPSEITINILTRLDVRAIATSKCVCKPWFDLLSADEFIYSHLSKSVPVLAVSMEKAEKSESVWSKVFGFGDGDEDEVDDVERRYIPLTKFDFFFVVNLLGAADGLLLLVANRRLLYICNPITREFVELCRSVGYCYGSVYGFGASKITRQHKAVLIVGCDSRQKCEVNVYTLETGSWRCFKATAKLDYYWSYLNRAAFVNGNLHWIRRNSIVCFDLETECFSMFSMPSLDERVNKKRLCASKDHLRVCVVMSTENKDLYVFVSEIWVMKEYGVEKSWTKEHVIGIHRGFAIEVINDFNPIKVFKNGDILISAGYLGCRLFHYSNKNQTARKIGMLQQPYLTYLNSALLTPSFLSLKRNLGVQNVISF